MTTDDNPTLGQEFLQIIFEYGNHYSWAVSRISELEDLLAEARDLISRMVEGNGTEWDT